MIWARYISPTFWLTLLEIRDLLVRIIESSNGTHQSLLESRGFSVGPEIAKEVSLFNLTLQAMVVLH